MTWNLGQKKTYYNRKQATPTKGVINWQIKQLQEKINTNKKLLEYLPYENDSDKNSVDCYDQIKERKSKKNSSSPMTTNDPQGEVAQNL